MENFNEVLIDLLKKDPRFVDNENNILRSKIIDAALNTDKELLSLLLTNKRIKDTFFSEVSGYWIFEANKFIDYIQDKNFLNDSYTKYRNKIGLTIDGKFLNERNEVALSFPFKDCILEGGQTKQENNRKEIFFNEILAQDEIDKLLAKKVLTNFKRYTEKGEEKVENFKRDSDGTIRDNLIIKGNNLLALHTIRDQFKGKIKLIYIDPPYNTGNDEFNYNDSFNHSTWLTFMKNRLEIAKEVLKEDGVIFVQCDDNEQAYLKVLMDEIFERQNFIATITTLTNRVGRNYKGIARQHDYVLAYGKSNSYKIYNLLAKNKILRYEDKIGKFDIRELRNRNILFNIDNRPNLYYPFFVNPKNPDENGFYEVSLEPKDGWIKILPKESQGIKTVWRWGKKKAEIQLNKNVVGKKMREGGFQIVEKYRDPTRMARSVWYDKEIRNEKGTLEVKGLFKGKRIFAYPKSEELIRRLIEMGAHNNDIVLDFTLGSGTTCAVAHKMKIQYIGIDQMNYVESAVERLQFVIKGENSGVSQLLNWKGGGDFIYLELARYNQAFVDQISNAKSTNELLKILKDIEERAFLKYNVDLKELDSSLEEFQKLTLTEQKETLISILNKNQLYVNLSDIDDLRFSISEEDKKLNKKFYSK